MNRKTITLVYFSPTATTRTVLEEIAKGTGYDVADVYDITLSKTRKQIPSKLDSALIVFGAPVYSGRLPGLAADYFKQLSAPGIPAVPVVLYGNREYEDALLELKDICVKCGCRPLAAGAFIGEHSFSTKQVPIALNRPDKKDLASAFEFGQKIAKLLDRPATGPSSGTVDVRGNIPYKTPPIPRGLPFIDVTDDCTACGICVAVCPVDAVNEKEGFCTMDEICVHCCACIKACPESARIMKDGPLKDIADRLNQTCGTRKAPETFFAAV
ncbi:MAG: 4Fe-4S binding protein [Desulfotignum sp.]|nr:4Fe-4S binding protein [Desulfotignum sp.]